MARKIKAVAAGPVYDGGELVANVGDEISEAAYDRLTGADQAVYQLKITGGPDEPRPAPEPKGGGK